VQKLFYFPSLFYANIIVTIVDGSRVTSKSLECFFILFFDSIDYFLSCSAKSNLIGE